MKILVTGASGLVGQAVVNKLEADKHVVYKLVRSTPKNILEKQWNPMEDSVDFSGLDGFDAVIHLAGESIADGRWTDEKKKRIRDSRVTGTRVLCQHLSKMKFLPSKMISASAIGFYGDRGQEIMTEEVKPGQGFLAEVCQEWENATKLLEEKNVNVVHLRIGLVLSKKGGALDKMLLPFNLGLGGKIGSGRQFMSWIALDDLVNIIHFLLIQKNVSGAVNAVSPSPVNNKTFTKTLGAVLGRPTVLPVPTAAIKLLFGEMGKELLLSSTFVEPKVLSRLQFPFKYIHLEDALRDILDK